MDDFADSKKSPMSSSSRSNSVEPIAIVGFGFKFPQDITDAESLWKLLMERRSTMTEIPKNRWNIDGFYKEHGHRPGTVKNRGGHFLADDPARFDAPFFSIQPAEAECMDPQQRLLLETSYHALENAGIPMQAAMGTRTSVHVGCLLQEYSQISQRDAQMPGDYRIVGSSGLAMLANRLSWFYDFSGPSMTVDTACSGGLVAFHLACQELSAGSVDMSLVCGNNLCLLPDSTALLSSLNMMSKDSVCYSFDERASGYARGEGFGVIILKRLDKAIADGDTIRGVVRSTGCGQDGNTPSITSPSQSAQERLIRETYARAGLDLGDTRYFEAHGTGTPVGDPCEAAAISNVFSCRTPEDPIFVGALKSNMGHPEGASGIASIIKTLLVLEKGIIPPNVYPERVNPAVTAAGPNLKFPLVPATWPTGGIRRASVNSFGYGGTNAHVVLDDALSFLRDHGLFGRHRTELLHDSEGATQPATYGSLAINGESDGYSTSTNACSESFTDNTPSDVMDDHETAPKLLILSAFDERAVQRSISAFEKWMRNHANDENNHQILNDVAYTLAEKRTSFPWKTVCVSLPNMLSQLSWSTPIRVKQRVNLCFVFTGQGTQWNGMGRELMVFPPFRDAMLGADRCFKSLGSAWSLIDELYHKSKEDSVIHQQELSQPICTALQVAIHDLLSSWKVCASISVGHSSGEIAAAYASRAISQESAWMIAYFRGLAVAITQTLNPSDGAMIAVQAPFDIWKHIMDKQNAEHPTSPIVIACYNSLTSFTLSGTHSTIHQMATALKQANIEVHILKIDVAYHSHYMKPVAGVYKKLLRTIEPGEQLEPQPSFVSTVTGKNVQQLNELQTSEYWQQNLTGSVKFSAALQSICARQDASTFFFLEIGPHSVLRSPLGDMLKESGRDVAIDYSSVLRRDRAADITALECAGRLHTIGATIDIAEVNKEIDISPKFLPSLPSYRFEDKKKYWLEGRTSIQYRQTQFVHHELLGSRTPGWNEHEARWTNRILLDQSPYLKDHQINGLCLMPAAGMLSMAIEATRQYYDHRAESASGYKLRDITFTKAMTLSADPRGTEIQLTLRQAVVDARNIHPGSLWDQFSLFVYEDGGWHPCCTGSIAIEYDDRSENSGELDGCATAMEEKKQAFLAASEECRITIDSADIYGAFDRAGLTYGSTFKGMRNVKWDQHNQATGTIGLRDWQTHAKFSYSDPHLIHPAALDTILQMTFPAYSIYAKDSSATTVPTGFSNAWFSAKLMRDPSDAQDVAVHAKVSGRGFRNKLFSVTAAFANTQELCFYGDLETSTIGRRNGPSAGNKEVPRSLYRIDWQPAKFDRLTAVSPQSTASKSCIHIIYDDSEPLQLDLMQALRRTMSAQDGIGVALVTWSSIAQHELDKATCVFIPGLDGTLLQRMQEDELAKIKSLLSKAGTVLWITFQHHILDQNPTEGLVSGLVRTLATESEDYRLVSVSLNPETGLDTVATNITKVTTALLEPKTDPEDEYCEIDGKLCTPRVVDDPELTAQALSTKDTAVTITKPWSELDSPKLTIGAAGALNTLHYEQASLRIDELASDDVVVQVKAVGLNTRDVLVSLGQVHDETFGSEIAGVVVSTGSSDDVGFQIGDHVFGVTRDGVAHLALCKVSQLQRIPDRMSFCEAAAYPVAFCTAYYSLTQCPSMNSGGSILVHDAASVLGQAVIQIAALHGYTKIFATASAADGASFLENTLNVPKSNIFSTDSLDFQHGIRRLTNGQGVAVVVGSEDRLRDSWPCIASFGRFVGVGEKDVFHSTANGSKEIVLPPTTKNIAFVSVNFQDLAKSEIFTDIFKHVLMLLGHGKITMASPLTVFKQSEIEHAFRRLKDVEMVEKVVIEMDSDEVVEIELAPNSTKPLFHPDASYLIAGAFGGIGQSIARWMVQRGAKHLILPSRSPVDGTGSKRDHFVQELKAQGAAVYAPMCDIANHDQLRKMLLSSDRLPAVKGCIQAAMVMRDSSFAKMTVEKWHESLAPKVDGSWNLHQLLPRGLDFFVMLSSSTGIMGSFGQSNYTVGNTYQDALAAHRMRHGERAHSFALSMVTGVGYVAQNDQVQALLRVRGMLEEVPMDDIYKLLRFCCDPDRVDTSTVGSQIITPLTLPADLRTMGIVAPLGSTRPIYHYLNTLPSRFSSDTASAKAKNRPSYKLSEATSLAHATDIVVEAIQTQLSSLLVVSKDDIDSQKAIYRYGVDSLVAVEMRNWFSKALGADVGTADIMSDISIWLLAVKVAGKSKFVRDELKE